jgi:hypothetical protein
MRLLKFPSAVCLRRSLELWLHRDEEPISTTLSSDTTTSPSSINTESIVNTAANLEPPQSPGQAIPEQLVRYNCSEAYEGHKIIKSVTFEYPSFVKLLMRSIKNPVMFSVLPKTSPLNTLSRGSDHLNWSASKEHNKLGSSGQAYPRILDHRCARNIKGLQIPWIVVPVSDRRFRKKATTQPSSRFTEGRNCANANRGNAPRECGGRLEFCKARNGHCVIVCLPLRGRWRVGRLRLAVIRSQTVNLKRCNEGPR